MLTHDVDGAVGAARRRVPVFGNLVLLFSLLGASLGKAADSQPPTGDLNTARTWVSFVGLGVQFLPDYNENGDGSGLKKQQFFADLSVDGRFTEDCAEQCSWRSFGSAHFGVRLLMLGTPVARTSTSGTQPTSFDDVANSVVFAPYLRWSIWQKSEASLDSAAPARQVHQFGPLVRGGVISSESLDADKDSVNWFYQVGLQYTYEGYRFRKQGSDFVVNGLPQGSVSVSFARFEDYANLNTEQHGWGKRSRIVVDAGYQILSSSRVYLGFKGNFGKGPDDFSVFLVHYWSPDRIMSFFKAD